MNDVHLVFPAGYDDPLRSSGGNRYDREVAAGLPDLGWTIHVHQVPNAWPTPAPSVAEAVDRQLARIPDEGVVIVDGLVGTVAASALVHHASRLRLVALVHMPGPPGGPPIAVLQAARLVFTTSAWAARTLVEPALSVATVLVAPPGVQPAERAIGTETGGALLCVAAVTKAKGHDVLVAALARLASRPWTCVCVGDLGRDPGFVQQLRQRLAGAGIADRVQLAGPLAGPDLDCAYAAADLVVLPTRLESYGMVVTEALARGLPVIATAVGGVPEAMGRAADGRRPGILVEPDEDQALADALTTWLDDPELRAELRSAAGARRADLGAWRQTVATISAALDHLAVR